MSDCSALGAIRAELYVWVTNLSRSFTSTSKYVLVTAERWRRSSNTDCLLILTAYFRNLTIKNHFYCCRVGDQTSEASHLVPEADRGLQECDNRRLDVFLEKRHRSLRPHPQVQASADVRIICQIISAGRAATSCVIIILAYVTWALSVPRNDLSKLSVTTNYEDIHISRWS